MAVVKSPKNVKKKKLWVKKHFMKITNVHPCTKKTFSKFKNKKKQKKKTPISRFFINIY